MLESHCKQKLNEVNKCRKLWYAEYNSLGIEVKNWPTVTDGHIAG